MTIDAVSRLLLHPDGGLKRVPDTARVIVAITQIVTENERAATELATILEEHPRIDRVVLLEKQ